MNQTLLLLFLFLWLLGSVTTAFVAVRPPSSHHHHAGRHQGSLVLAFAPSAVKEGFHKGGEYHHHADAQAYNAHQYRSSSRLYYRNKNFDNSTFTNPAIGLDFVPKRDHHLSFEKQDKEEQDRVRQQLKNELAKVAIEQQTTTRTSASTAEDIMKQLEHYCPVQSPVLCESLMNARWSFVFTGVPTIGMKLITLLSRMSVQWRPIEFHDVYLQVQHRTTQVQATVRFCVLGLAMELEVQTKLEPHPDRILRQQGTVLLETFQSLSLNGVTIPTPHEWHSSRNLEIRYLDEELMIARTAGGEPHLLLRHSPCSTDALYAQEEECDIDNDLTEYFATAAQHYGRQRLSRSLVDRAYGLGGDNNDNEDHDAAASIPQLLQSILLQEPSHR